eukprot:156763_1
MNESKDNNETHLSNDPIFVNDEIETLHRKIFHLRRTNNEIRKLYSNDPDCIQALNENGIIIEKTLNSLFIYFKLYKQLTQKEHFYIKLYESDIKIKNKFDKKKIKNKQLKEFDLDYVAQRLKEKTKELEMEKKNMELNVINNDVSKDNNKNNNDNDDCIADDDGGFVL